MTGYVFAAIILSFFGGNVVGALALSILWTRYVSKPAHAREFMQRMYAQAAHPHWLQQSKDDPRKICPCCGWSEADGQPKPA